MTSDVTREEFSQLQARVDVVEREVDGEKLVTRYILEQARKNGDDLAAIKGRLGRLEARFDGLETRFDRLETRVAGLEARFDGLETRFDRLETRVAGLEIRFDGLEISFDRLERKVDMLDQAIKDLVTALPAIIREVLRERGER
jgi:chromosome segregation ATPase